jgi:hypothetical protein
MARKLVVEIIGDTSHLEKSYRSAERGTKRFGQSIEKAGRGAVVASVGFHGLGRAVGFASASFLGGAGFIAVIRSSVEQATEQTKILANLRNSLQAGGFSWRQYGAEVQRATDQTKALSAFDDDELYKSLQLLVRGTGSVSKALQLNALAADVARGRNMGLVQAAQLLVRVNAGQIGSLRRLGIQVDKNATGQQALAQVQRQYAGAAAAYGRTAAGAQDRFRVAVEDLQKAIGAELLPTITKYLTKGADWLNDTKNQKRVTDDFRTAVVILTGSFGKLATAIDKVTGAYEKLRDVTGKGKAGQGGGTGALDNLKLLVGGTLIEQLQHTADLMNRLNRELGAMPKNANDARVAVGAFVHDIGAGPFGATRSPLLPRQTVTFPRKAGPDPFKDAGPGAILQGPNITQAQRNAFFDSRISRMLDRVQDITSLRGQIARLKEIAGLIQKRHDATKDITRKLTLEDQLAQIARDILGDQAAIADKDAAAAAKAAEAAKKRAEAAKKLAEAIRKANKTRLDALAKEIAAGQKYTASFGKLIATRSRQRAAARRSAEQAKVFGLLGLTATGEERAPSRGNLLASLQKAQAAIAGTPVDSKAMRSRLSQLRTVINTEFGKLTRDTKTKVGEFLDALAGKGQAGDQARFARTSTARLLGGLGLDPAQTRALRARLTQVGPGGTVATGSRAFSLAGGVTIHTVNVHGVQDVAAFENELVKRASKRPVVRRGAR